MRDIGHQTERRERERVREFPQLQPIIILDSVLYCWLQVKRLLLAYVNRNDFDYIATRRNLIFE